MAKKDKKNKKNKEVTIETTNTGEEANDIGAPIGTEVNPIVLDGVGLVLYKAIVELMEKSPGDTFYQIDAGIIRGRNTVNAETQKSRMSFQLDGARITAPNLKNLLKEKSAATNTPEERKEEIESDEMELNSVLVTDAQLTKKYKVKKAKEVAEELGLGKKKYLSAYALDLDAMEKKKITGQVIHDKLKSTFLKLADKDIFNYFEALEG